MELSLTNILIAGSIIGLLSPWAFLAIYMRDRKRESSLWRETLVYLKSASAFEAEDAIDRVHRREKPLLERALDKKRKQDENLSDAPLGDMAQDMRQTLDKQYN